MVALALPERLSVVVPAWNEEPVIGRLVEELDREVASRFADAEIIVVDDASSDGTGRVLAELAARLPRLRVLTAAQNAGHGPSVLRGLAAAEGDWLFQLDSDGQFVVADFWELWARHDEADLVLGVRATRRDPRHRIALSRVVGALVSLLAGRAVRDANVPFRLIRRSLWEDLRPLVGEQALAPSIFVACGAAVRGWRIAEVPVRHLPRQSGPSTLRAFRLLRFCLRGLGELVRFRLALARSAPRDG